MRAAAILGLGCSPKALTPFQTDSAVEWRMGMPASGDEADVILIFGGDGTIHRHLNQLVKLSLPVLVVPAGSGNDFARALGLRSVRDSLAAWKKVVNGAQNIRLIDLGTITPLDANSPQNRLPGTRYFSCVAGIGLDAEVARRANRLPRLLRGHGGYALTLAPTIFNFAPFPMKVWTESANSESWNIRSDQTTILTAFANTPHYGGGMKIAPHARMDDGLLDTCIVGGVNPFKLFALFPSVYLGKHLGIRGVEYFQSARARIETEQPLDVYADGEYVCRTPVEIGIQPSSLKVLVPLSS
jgi:YegS/Rv2252/BmrU family lipid kinase